MTIEGVFSACNLLAMAGWILLLTVPRQRTAMAIAGTAIPLTLATIYLVLLVLHMRESSGGFSSLAAVAQLFANTGCSWRAGCTTWRSTSSSAPGRRATRWPGVCRAYSSRPVWS